MPQLKRSRNGLYFEIHTSCSIDLVGLVVVSHLGDTVLLYLQFVFVFVVGKWTHRFSKISGPFFPSGFQAPLYL